MVTRRTVWQKPRLRTDEEEQRERRVSWLELFYDLVFVVVVAELSHGLAKHVTPDGARDFMLLFIPVWWVWIGGTFYNERFETEDLSNRVFTFLQMLPVATLAVFAHDGAGKTAVGFILSYVAARLILIGLWLRGGWHDARFRPVTTRYAIGFSLSVALFLVSILVPAPGRFALWGLALLIDLATPMTTLRLQARLPRLSTSRLPERFGLFVIIVLGESVVGVVRGLAAKPTFELPAALSGLLGMGLGFGMWWLYFDYVSRRRARPGPWWSLAWGYLHLPLVMGTVAIGAGVLNVVASDEAALPDAVRWLLAGALAMALTAIAAIELTARHTPDEPTHPRLSPGLKLGAAAVALALGAAGGGLGPLPLLTALLGLVIIQMIYGAVVWFRQPIGGVSAE